MAKIRLFVQQSLRTPEQTVLDAEGNPVRVPFLRLLGLLLVGERAHSFCDCLIDTGAPLSIFPLLRWRPFEQDIEWLSVPTEAQTSWLTQVSGWAGGSQRCRIGRVLITAIDPGPPRAGLPPVKVLGLFEESNPRDERILIGLHASILQGRRLIVDPDQREAWLEEAETKPGS